MTPENAMSHTRSFAFVARPSLRRRLESLVELLTKHNPFTRPICTEAASLDDLERLALLSPHLLADLGFEEDREASGPGWRIWRKGNLSVTLYPSGEGAVARAEAKPAASLRKPY